MRGIRFRFYIVLSTCLGVLFYSAQGIAEIYKYQDEKGNWRFSDRPPPGSQQTVEKVSIGAKDSKEAEQDLTVRLQEKFSPKTPLQQATLGTVTIKTPVGSGSGFFVSESGHIITNKHVLKVDEEQLDQAQLKFNQTEQQLDSFTEQLVLEKSRLKRYKQDLVDYDRYIRSLRDSPQKTAEQKHYQLLQKQYQQREKDYAENRRKARAHKREFETQQREFNWKRHVAGATRNFTIVLKDGTELNARLIKFSEEHDLALLKLDNYQTPTLKPATAQEIGQGMPVYAIGSPIGIRDSVSNGVVSGLGDGFIRTDAKIYPGNSGGPLVLENGHVVGINTMVRVTHKFEGLGYAIEMDTALQEFAGYLPTN
ncbi:MAG: trypsin-like peptidase domain-containing protein [Candidatus Competibacteraceae bacterium]|nr:trypsin-like peptidase domain-containing protein [Candidatus Competibacteraceae bacterium]